MLHVGFFLVAARRGFFLFIEVCSFLVAITSPIEKHSLYRVQGLHLLLHADSVLVAKEWAKFPCFMWRD